MLSQHQQFQMTEMLNRLENNHFVSRPHHKTRRSDGDIVTKEENNKLLIQIRINSFDEGKSGVLTLSQNEQKFTLMSVMIRDRRFGGDDRASFIIPQKIGIKDIQIIENIVMGACVCIGRGSVRKESTDLDISQNKFSLYLPSITPLPIFTKDFSVINLPSQY